MVTVSRDRPISPQSRRATAGPRTGSKSKAGQGNRGIAIAALVVNSILLLLNLTLLVFTFGIMGFGIFSGGGP